MRILFVGMTNSIHLARWVNQLDCTDWERFLFPIYSVKPHAELKGLTLINSSEIPGFQSNRSLRYINSSLPFFVMNLMNRIIQKNLNPLRPAVKPSPVLIRALINTIKQVKPDIIHSMEFQEAGYLTLEAKKRIKTKFPKWIATNWGSDIYLFGRLKEHRERVRAVVENCDYYSCECQRDVLLAREFGLRGEVLPVFPNTGGFDLAAYELMRNPGNVSERKLILLKGYQGWAGRALVGLRALARCVDILKAQEYSIAVYSSSPDMNLAIELFTLETGVSVEIIPPCSHTDMLRIYGRARIYIGLSISDAISTSLLESIVMGTFPIQSCTACADEWIVDGQSGLIVPPEDVDVVEKALRRAMTDDVLVDKAATLNRETARKRLDSTVIKPQVINFYQHVYNSILEN
ncbi:MAG: glycosyltransferase family 4 protein [Chloroflexi bacterium]|nr:glycosyltransferase family 4 protein [Chloroflexota bacterium]